MTSFLPLFSSLARAALIIGLFYTSVASAATLTVSNNNSLGAGSLRQVILGANSGDTIIFGASLTNATIVFSQMVEIDKELSIDGKGEITINANHVDHNGTIFRIKRDANLSLKGLTFTNDDTGTSTAAMFVELGATLNVDTSVFRNITSTSSSGGAIHNRGRAVVSNSSFINNSSANTASPAFAIGGAISTSSHAGLLVTNSTFAGNSARRGGALHITGNAMVEGCTFLNNTAAGGVSGGGGAIYNGGEFGDMGLMVTNSTFSENVASGSSRGGGIATNSGGETQVVHSTFYNNRALTGATVSNSGITHFANSLIYDATSPGDISHHSNCDDAATPATFAFTLVESNQSVITCNFNASAEINLEPLADNGCATAHATPTGLDCVHTHEMQGGSDGENTMIINTLSYDQRGVSRPQGTGHELGAFERSDTTPDFKGTIVIALDTVPDDGQDFSFGMAGGLSTTPVVLDDDADGTNANTQTFTDVLPGQYQISVDPVLGYVNTSISCSDGTSTTPSSGDEASRTATINLDSSETVTCTYTYTICPDVPMDVANQAQLNDAIHCYNAETSADDYEINLSSGFTLSGATTEVNNSTSGISLAINGGGFTLDGNDAHRHFTINESKVNIDYINLENGRAINGGSIAVIGARSELNLSNSTLSANTAESLGGGIYNALGTATISNSTLSGNAASGTFGGGGVYNEEGKATISNSTLSGNTGTRGGGITNFSGVGTTIISNSTISGNAAASFGGGIYSNHSTTIINSTLSDNTASSVSGIFINGGSTTISNSIVANNLSGANCGGVSVIADSYNLATDNTCGSATPKNLAEINLGLLTDNNCATMHATSSGPACVKTHALLENSAAINAGNNAVCNGAPVNGLDQRGMTRPQPVGGICDVGAVEQVECPGLETVINEGQLHTAILCFNQEITPGSKSITVGSDIQLTTDLPSISNDLAGINLMIDGTNPSGGRFTVDGQDAFHPFEVDVDTVVEISNLIVTNGLARGSSHRENDGGAIRNLGDLTLTDVEISDSYAEDEGGGIYSEEYSTLTIVRGLIKANAAEDEGGGLFIEEYASLYLIDSTVDDNESQGDGGPGASFSFSGGGGIASYGEATLVNTAVTNNRALSIYDEGEPAVEEGVELGAGFEVVINESYGGGISNLGYMEIRFDEELSDNPSTVSNNLGYDGGGIYNEGYLEASDTLVKDNESQYGGGVSIYSYVEFYDEFDGEEPIKAKITSGAAAGLPDGPKEPPYMLFGYTRLSRTTIIDNLAAELGGGISNYGDFEELPFGPIGPIGLSAVDSENPVLEGPVPEGPVIRPFIEPNLIIEYSTISNNEAGTGGGLGNFMGLVQIHKSTIDNNEAALDLDSISDSCCSPIPFGGGGGIFNIGFVAIDNSTISNNAALMPLYPETGIEELSSQVALGGGEIPFFAANGGGISNLFGLVSSTHNTLSGNTAANLGGGIYNGFDFSDIVGDALPEVLGAAAADGANSGSESRIIKLMPHRDGQTLSMATAVSSAANESSTGEIIILPPTIEPLTILNISNTIIANSQSGFPLSDGGDCVNEDLGEFGPFIATVFDGGYNLIEESEVNGECGFTSAPNDNILGEDPLLGDLGENGGLTKTHLLKAGSLAIDAIDSFMCGGGLYLESPAEGMKPTSPFMHDQRDISRPQGLLPNCDIGSVEMQTSTITLTKVVNNEGGGTLTANDFALSATVEGDISIIPSGDYIEIPAEASVMLGEATVSNYVFESLSGEGCPIALNTAFDVPEDNELSCVITNCFDLDGDNLCSALDPDDDGDGVNDDSDNCPLIANPGQLNTDFDVTGDDCDLDDDNDGMTDVWEIANGLDPKQSWDRDLDPDGDGFTNFEEFMFGTDPNEFNADEDKNGVPDSAEKVNITPILQLLLLDEVSP